MSTMTRCDGPECETYSKTRPLDWLKVTETHRPDSELWFHCWECCIRFGANLPAPKETPWGAS